MDKLPKYKVAHEAAAQLQVSVPLVRRWIRQGRMKAFAIGDVVAIPDAEIERMKSRNTKRGPRKGASSEYLSRTKRKERT